jgi:peptidoglycan/xylan/chitin deacetylase (PgdA/CDA1 family)
MFHRVLPKGQIKSNNAYFIRGTMISQERLENVIKSYLNNSFAFKTLNELKLDNTQREVVLTFDDGYLDNYLYALPILNKYNIKATFYPIIGNNVEQVLSPLDYYYHYVDINIPANEKESWITGKIKSTFRNLEVKKQKQYISELFNHHLPNIDIKYMSILQLLELHKMGHEIGGHSYYHDIYTNLSNQDIHQDIKNTITAFKNINIDIKTYAYTDGQYNIDTINYLLDYNIDKACAIKSINIYNNPNFELERKFVKENEIIG